MQIATLVLVSLLSMFGSSSGSSGGGEKSMKGWELYAWHDASCADHTCFALLPGTNRNKTTDEVRRAPLDIAALEARIDTLASGEDVFWLAPDDSFLAPTTASSPTQRAVAACAKRGVTLTLASIPR